MTKWGKEENSEVSLPFGATADGHGCIKASHLPSPRLQPLPLHSASAYRRSSSFSVANRTSVSADSDFDQAGNGRFYSCRDWMKRYLTSLNMVRHLCSASLPPENPPFRLFQDKWIDILLSRNNPRALYQVHAQVIVHAFQHNDCMSSKLVAVACELKEVFYARETFDRKLFIDTFILKLLGGSSKISVGESLNLNRSWVCVFEQELMTNL